MEQGTTNIYESRAKGGSKDKAIRRHSDGATGWRVSYQQVSPECGKAMTRKEHREEKGTLLFTLKTQSECALPAISCINFYILFDFLGRSLLIQIYFVGSSTHFFQHFIWWSSSFDWIHFIVSIRNRQVS